MRRRPPSSALPRRAPPSSRFITIIGRASSGAGEERHHAPTQLIDSAGLKTERSNYACVGAAGGAGVGDGGARRAVGQKDQHYSARAVGCGWLERLALRAILALAGGSALVHGEGKPSVNDTGLHIADGDSGVELTSACDGAMQYLGQQRRAPLGDITDAHLEQPWKAGILRQAYTSTSTAALMHIVIVVIAIVMGGGKRLPQLKVKKGSDDGPASEKPATSTAS